MPHISLVPEHLFSIFGFPVTNTLLTAWVVMLLLAVLGFFLKRHIKEVPGRVQNAAELALESVLDFMAMISGNRESARKHFPIVATIFFFILFSNWMGILPGIGSIGFYEMHEGVRTFVPFFRSVNSDLNMTLALALFVVTATQVIGVSALGAIRHTEKFLTLKSPVNAFVGILELISEFAKIISFSFRLFGNIFAGEVLLVIMSFLIPYLVPVPFMGLELFVGAIQAGIFAVLAMLFFASAEISVEHA